MCHALGQEHEQSRTDRDNYVEMLWSNIQDGQGNVNMRKENTRDNHPYDLESVLQYSLGAFAIDTSRPTMRVLDPKLAFLADAATGLMYYDVRDITTVYQCTRGCSNPPNCLNGGFLNHRCQCYCPSGLTGNDCSQIQTDNSELENIFDQSVI
ncbi:hypothetical protein FSP39_008844 [Pinctada imbricata]|uniref:Metalloendopeptidase n=1 Tax=Pinctada imbricata TaxID=66713 RepID=A0AA89BYS2_PINIB|nr:hypothetical protein FSP39_008844 [Pinctada imbricata]